MPRKRLRLMSLEPLLLSFLVMFAVCDLHFSSFYYYYYYIGFCFCLYFSSSSHSLDGVKTKEVFAEAAKHHNRNIDVCIMSAGVSVPLLFEVRKKKGRGKRMGE